MSPGCTLHCTSSTSAMPSPISGTLTTWSAISGLPACRPEGGRRPFDRPRSKLSSWRHSHLRRTPQRLADTVRAGEIRPLLGMRIGRVPAGYALDGRFEMKKTVLLHQCRKLSAEAARARRFVHDHTAAGLFYGGHDRLEVERPQAAQVDDLGVDAGFACRGFGDPYHRAVGEHRDRTSRPTHCGRFERHGVVIFRNLGEGVACPGFHGNFVVTVEGSFLNPRRLEKQQGGVKLD